MSGPLFHVSKSGINIVDVSEFLELGCKKFENKNIFVAPWTLELGVLKVNKFIFLSLTLYLSLLPPPPLLPPLPHSHLLLKS
jgi:hypothetical protein